MVFRRVPSPLFQAIATCKTMSVRRSSRIRSSNILPIATADSTVSQSSKQTKRKSIGQGEKKVKISSTVEAIPAPSTPQKKRKIGNSSSIDQPATPIPALVAQQSNGNDTNLSKLEFHHPTVRPVDPHVTNALLRTPKGSRIANTSVLGSNGAPLANGSHDSLTTENLLEKATQHLLSVDPSLKPVIDQNYCNVFSPAGLAEEIDPFRSLVSGICAQQVSGAAARAIKSRFVALYDLPKDSDALSDNSDLDVSRSNSFPSPEAVAATDITRLREAGLSQRKAEYIQGLAAKFASGELSARKLVQASDEEVLEMLTAVRGLGKWSVEMFACFGLKRMDILSTGDLGVQRGMAAYAGRDVAKLKAKGGGKWKYMSEEEMIKRAEPFAPYRSLFMWYMWRIEDVDVSAMAN